MNKLSKVVLITALALVGCKKERKAENTAQDPGAPSQVSAERTASESRPANPVASANAVPPKNEPPTPSVTARADNQVRENVVGDVDPTLTSLLRAFVQKKGHLPQSFGEFASAGLDSVPRPPDGKKWVIDAATQTVKAVAK